MVSDWGPRNLAIPLEHIFESVFLLFKLGEEGAIHLDVLPNCEFYKHFIRTEVLVRVLQYSGRQGDLHFFYSFFALFAVHFVFFLSEGFNLFMV